MSIRALKLVAILVSVCTAYTYWNRASIAAEPRIFRRHTVGIPRELVASPAAAPKAVGAKPKIHALILGYSRDPEIGDGIAESGLQLEAALISAFSESELFRIHVVGIDRKMRGKNDSKFQQDVIEKKIADVRNKVVAQQDTLFCYVMTHGAFDGRHSSPDQEYGHWFQTEKTGEVYKRVELMESLLSAKARLTVLMSDTCNVRCDEFEPTAAEKSWKAPFGALRSLLLEHRGQVDISASSQGQFSFYGDAGMFTTAFLGLAESYREQTTWQEFYSVLQAATQAEFERAYPEGCPWAWDEDTRTMIAVSPKDRRAQKELRPFAMRPITWVVHDTHHAAPQP